LAIGAALAAFIGGTLADRSGRRKTLLFSNIYGLVVSLLFCFIEMMGVPELFIVLRILIGLMLVFHLLLVPCSCLKYPQTRIEEHLEQCFSLESQ